MYFLGSLPQGVLINILRFGSTYQSLFKESQPLNEQTLAEARTYSQQTTANLGGTGTRAQISDYIWISFEHPRLYCRFNDFLLLTCRRTIRTITVDIETARG
jgi:hypothetical protein